ncbi:hypothetical protein SUGI_0578840 [Cryptomeria japonica]|nr:hypothetical protein SUGI_0578840 [Cryptomeria japonica]
MSVYANTSSFFFLVIEDKSTKEQQLQQQEGKQSRKVREQEPSVLPCQPSASPLSPQLSCNGTQYFGPSAKALNKFLNSQGLRFDEVYACPVDRAKHTALFLCHEMDMLEEKTQCSGGLIKKSQGQWECCPF